MADIEYYKKQIDSLKDIYECILENCSSTSNPNPLRYRTGVAASLDDAYSMLEKLEALEVRAKGVRLDLIKISGLLPLVLAPVLSVSYFFENHIPRISAPFIIIIQAALLMGLSLYFPYLSEIWRLINIYLVKRKIENDLISLIDRLEQKLRFLSYSCQRPLYQCR